jgi:hypothetical protein
MLEKPAEQPSIRDVLLTISLSPHTHTHTHTHATAHEHSYRTQPNPWLLTLIQPSSGVDYTFATLPRLARRVSGNNRGVVIMSQRVGKGGVSFLFIYTHFIRLPYFLLQKKKKVETFISYLLYIGSS